MHFSLFRERGIEEDLDKSLLISLYEREKINLKEFKIAVQTDRPDRPQSFRHEHRDDVFRQPGQ
jgi:hypothetical protein